MNSTYFDSKNKKDCNGCGVCSLVCPKKCIKMTEDEEGFLYPQIDLKECVRCNICRKICSNVNNKKENNEKAYFATNKDDKELKESSSGGIFSVLARNVIEKKRCSIWRKI